MTAPSRGQAENALAALVHAIRPDWATPGILAVIRKRPDRPLDQLTAAAVWATTRRDQHAPHLIGEDDGEAFDRLLGKLTGPPSPQPTRGCPYHAGQPRDCPACAEQARTVADRGQVAGHMATIRAAIAATKAARTSHDHTAPVPGCHLCEQEAMAK